MDVSLDALYVAVYGARVLIQGRIWELCKRGRVVDLHLEIPNNLSKMQTKGGKNEKEISNDRNASYGGNIVLCNFWFQGMYFSVW